MTQKKQTYEELKAELDSILESIQSKDGSDNLDELLKLYKRGEEVLAQMQKYLDTAKNEIKKIKGEI